MTQREDKILWADQNVGRILAALVNELDPDGTIDQFVITSIDPMPADSAAFGIETVVTVIWNTSFGPPS